MRQIIAAGIAAAALVTLSSTPAEAATHYSSCAKLTRAWPNGVARSAAAAAYQVRQGNSRPAYSTKARAVYAENHRSLDRDDDGTACEN